MTKRRKVWPWSWRPKTPADELSDAAHILLDWLREVGSLDPAHLGTRAERAAEELEGAGYVDWSDDGRLILREDR